VFGEKKPCTGSCHNGQLDLFYYRDPGIKALEHNSSYFILRERGLDEDYEILDGVRPRCYIDQRSDLMSLITSEKVTLVVSLLAMH
jgi:hypothetical protein